MATDQSKCSTSGIGESSDSTIQINVKSLDSQIYTFSLNRDTPIPSLKEKVASASGIPVEQQRLIFRGKVLKDDHLLSDYHLEDGHTLHLVARPVEAQTQSGTVSGGQSHNNDQGTDSSTNSPPNRIGQVSHSVVLGTVNISDQREGMGLLPDIGRVVGAVLQSIGAGILSPAGANNTPSVAVNQAAPSNSTGHSQDASGRAQQNNQTQPPVTLVNQPFQVQLASPAALQPNMVIPDSLRTLSDYINRMELILQNSGSQSSAPSNTQNIPRSDTTSLNGNRVPTPDVLGSVIDQARVLLSGNTATAFSHMAERLRREATSDPLVRSQIQTEAMHLGLVMQHLGAMLLELGRTTMMLRTGSSSDGSFVNSGPAVYISSTGPNPIMVQPSPPQLSSFFTGASPLISGPSNILNAGDLLRNINVHVLSGTSLAPSVSSSGARESTRDLNYTGRQNMEQANQTSNASGPLGNAAPMRGMTARTVVAAIPGRSPSEHSGSGPVLSVLFPVHVGSQPSNPTPSTSSQNSHPSIISGTQPATAQTVQHSSSESAIVPQVVAQEHTQTDHSGTAPDQTNGCAPAKSISDTVGQQLVTEGSASRNSCENIVSDWTDNSLDSANKNIETHVPGISTAAGKQHSLITGGMGGSASSKPVNTLTTKEKSSEDKMKDIAQSSKSGGTDRTTPLGLGLGGLQPKKRRNVAKPIVKDGKSHDSSSVSQNQESISRGQELLRSIVSHVSDGNRDSMNMSSGPFPSAAFNQFARSINFVGQDSRERVNAGDLMSQVLGSPAFNNFLTNFGGVPSVSVNESEPESQSYNTIRPDERIHKSELQSPQIDLHEAQQKIEQNDSPGSIFRAMLESAGGLYGEDNHEGLLQELGDDVELSNEYSEILHRHIQQRLTKEPESKEKF
ncbi:ubiquitin-like domain-containing protein CIP73 [Zingiber officinale]|uniref:ubiquitin-like domain-containing protein CIP73 n=1 Tax=Zingiber officinale TaxID=94328 RepID=UPI001C4A78FD|nr:ubiquitin-like domain-containing protein CIP73 [Zingiber officinale]